jgi:hypothetical protein
VSLSLPLPRAASCPAPLPFPFVANSLMDSPFRSLLDLFWSRFLAIIQHTFDTRPPDHIDDISFSSLHHIGISCSSIRLQQTTNNSPFPKPPSFFDLYSRVSQQGDSIPSPTLPIKPIHL